MRAGVHSDNKLSGKRENKTVLVIRDLRCSRATGVGRFGKILLAFQAVDSKHSLFAAGAYHSDRIGALKVRVVIKLATDVQLHFVLCII